MDTFPLSPSEHPGAGPELAALQHQRSDELPIDFRIALDILNHLVQERVLTLPFDASDEAVLLKTGGEYLKLLGELAAHIRAGLFQADSIEVQRLIDGLPR